MQTKLELYRKVTPLAGLGIWERNLVTGEVYWNTVVRQIYAVPEDFNMSLDNSLAFYHNKAAIENLLETAAKTGDPQIGQLQITAQDGRQKWVKIRVQAELEEERCTAIYGTLEEITEQVALFHRMAEQEAQFHQAFEFAPIGIALVSLKGQWMRVNPKISEMLGYSAPELFALSFQQITHPDDLQSDLDQMQQLVNGNIGSYQMDKRYFHKDGNVIWASLYVSLVRDQNGSPLYFVSQLKDITERKRMEFERVNTLEIITAQNSRLLNFAHIVSHNLRSHGSNIELITQLLGEETDPTEKEQLTNLLKVNARNLQETLADLNDVVDVQSSGKQTIRSLNLYDQVFKIAEVMGLPLQQVDGILVNEIDKDLWFDYDQAYLDSILLNLLTNAIKYRDPERPLLITLKARQEGEKIILTVSDNGLGIDMTRYGDQLFGMYNTFHGNGDARGIGLFLIKSQVEVMGGRISASSSPGAGMTFTLEFN